jgi:hypothetical protein
VTTTTCLTKSRFVLATECARKLTYALDPRYPDAMEDDDFLKSLADGGHQVGALARLVYGGGTLITERDRKEQARRTAELLTRPDVTIYEGTVIHERLLVRCDILVKHGSELNLIEVKSKSSEPTTKFTKGNEDAPEIAGDWEPYLYDLAYQAFVLQHAYPDLVVTPHLLLVDKTVPASVAGLNTIFTVTTEGRNVAVTVAPEFDVTKLAPPVLREFDLSREIALLRGQPITAIGIAQTFEDFVALLCSRLDNLHADGPHALPRSVTPQCRDCSFYLDPAEQSEEKRSGWHRCMAESYDKLVNIARGQTFFGLYKPGKGQIADFLLTQPLAIADMSREAFTPGENASAVIDDAERQRLQWEEHHGETEPSGKTWRAGPGHSILLISRRRLLRCHTRKHADRMSRSCSSSRTICCTRTDGLSTGTNSSRRRRAWLRAFPRCGGSARLWAATAAPCCTGGTTSEPS